MTAKEAEKACATKGLVLVAENASGGDNALVMACRKRGPVMEIVFSCFADELPDCVEQFKAWRKAGLRKNASQTAKDAL